MAQQGLFGEAPEPIAKPRQTGKPTAPSQYSWFFALRPSAEDARRIHASAESLLAANGITGNRIDPDRLHITLELVGHDVGAGVVEAACRSADAVTFPVIEARFDAALTFAGPSGPLVLVGAAGLDEVRRLRIELGCEMADRGFSPVRGYDPHMTVCYDAHNRLARLPIEPIGFRADKFALVKSHIGLSRHEVLNTWRLTG